MVLVLVDNLLAINCFILRSSILSENLLSLSFYILEYDIFQFRNTGTLLQAMVLFIRLLIVMIWTNQLFIFDLFP